MANQFITTFTRDQLKDLVRESVHEALDSGGAKSETLEILDLKAACQLTGYSSHSLYRKTSRREIPHFKRGNKLLFRRDELLRWLQETKVQAENDSCTKSQTDQNKAV